MTIFHESASSTFFLLTLIGDCESPVSVVGGCRQENRGYAFTDKNEDFFFGNESKFWNDYKGSSYCNGDCVTEQINPTYDE